jgi:2-polyprenyl-3-methyl-5-hydroxy-6-metoxy-1,4-benzoquinol methylase
LKGILCAEFGLNLEKPVYLIYWHQNQERILPLTSLKHLIFSKDEEESLVVRVRGEIQQKPSSSSSVMNFDVWEDQKYFSEYSHYHIHYQMLSDSVRCLTYKNAIEEFSELIRDKIVLDVGCGTGLLSCFCAKVGAKKVYAVEASEMVNAAELVIEKNGFSETVQIFHSKVEEVALPVNKDVIISEWMGVFLLFEGMLESVIYARNKWLSEEGILFPAKAKLYLAPIYFEDYFRSRVSLFTSAYGVDMAPLLPFVKEDFTAHPLRGEVVPQECIISNPTVILSVDIKTIQAEEIRKFTSPFTFTPSTKHDKMHGFVTWFEVIFEGKVSDRPQIVLTTSPFSK